MSITFLILMIAAAVAISWPLGKMMTWAMEPAGNPGLFRRPFEKLLALIIGKAGENGQGWKSYLFSMLAFNAVMFVITYTIFLFQDKLPLNPAQIAGMEPSLAFNTAASFTANTNLQHYSGENGLSYFSQSFAIMWLQFVSAATGIAALAAMSRSLAGKKTAGNFFSDMMRASFLILLPVAFVSAALLVLGGTVMTFGGPVTAHTLEGAVQTIARGPVATFAAITQLGTNGGGFFGPNGTHAFSNPTFFTNIIQTLSLIAIPMASVWMFGRITGRLKHAGVIFAVMLLILVCNLAAAVHFEAEPTKALAGLNAEQSASGNLEGKELRFGGSAAPLWTILTTSSSNGSVNNMHDSLNPITGLTAMIGMWLNVVFGGVGVGVINMFVFIIIGVFVCGMMVGRTPEYMNKKIETPEMKLALLALLVHPFFILGGTALFAATPWGAETVANPGIHGFSEILYEFTSSAANNGSGFEGLGDNTAPWNIATGLVMLLGRFLPIIFCIAAAGMMSEKTAVPETSGTLHTDTPLFAVVLLGSVIFIGALLFMPVAALGPIAEYLTL